MSEIRTMQIRDMQKVSATQKVMKVITQILLYTFLSIMALIVIFPFYWMIISSIKTMDEYRRAIPTLIPEFFDFRQIRYLQRGDQEGGPHS